MHGNVFFGAVFVVLKYRLIVFIVKIDLDVLGIAAFIDFPDEFIGFAVLTAKITFIGVVHLKKYTGETGGLSLTHHMVDGNAVQIVRAKVRSGETGIEETIMYPVLQPFPVLEGRLLLGR